MNIQADTTLYRRLQSVAHIVGLFRLRRKP